jgi:hypothetical protein
LGHTNRLGFLVSNSVPQTVQTLLCIEDLTFEIQDIEKTWRPTRVAKYDDAKRLTVAVPLRKSVGKDKRVVGWGPLIV